MLLVVAAFPVTATVCEALCEGRVTSVAATTGASGHEGMAGCHEPPAPGDQQLSSASLHCRTHDDGRRQAEAVSISNRIHAVVMPVASAPAMLGAETPNAQSLQALSGSSPPRGSVLSHTSLVLRI